MMISPLRLNNQIKSVPIPNQYSQPTVDENPISPISRTTGGNLRNGARSQPANQTPNNGKIKHTPNHKHPLLNRLCIFNRLVNSVYNNLKEFLIQMNSGDV